MRLLLPTIQTTYSSQYAREPGPSTAFLKASPPNGTSAFASCHLGGHSRDEVVAAIPPHYFKRSDV